MTLPVQADPGLVIEDGTVPVVRQRVAAYAVVRSSRGLLATEFSARTAVEGLWGMPGGGLDDHEEPAAVRAPRGGRGDLPAGRARPADHGADLALGRSQPGRHGRGLPGRSAGLPRHCPDPTDPVVRDRDGTTNDARWVELDEWRSLPWTVGWWTILSELLRPSKGVDP